jgi:hypothetical protein
VVDLSLSRRSLIAFAVAGGAGLVTTACSRDEPTATEKAPPPSPAELTPDVAVATTALAEITAVRAAATSTLARFPAVRPQLSPVVAMHRAHEVTLADAVPARARTTTAPAPYVVPRRRAVALAALAAREQKLHTTLDGLSLRAQSGEFARLLASMGAGISQRLTAWPT